MESVSLNNLDKGNMGDDMVDHCVDIIYEVWTPTKWKENIKLSSVRQETLRYLSYKSFKKEQIHNFLNL